MEAGREAVHALWVSLRSKILDDAVKLFVLPALDAETRRELQRKAQVRQYI
jgi:hypothetical protein